MIERRSLRTLFLSTVTMVVAEWCFWETVQICLKDNCDIPLNSTKRKYWWSARWRTAKGCRICRLCRASSIQTFPLIQSPLVKGSFQHLWGDALVRGCSESCALCRTQMAQTGYRVLQTRKLKSAGGWQENWFAWSKLIKRKRYSLLLLFESVPLFPDVSLSESSSCLKEMV